MGHLPLGLAARFKRLNATCSRSGATILNASPDEAVRGRGVGKLLGEAAISRAAEAGAKTVDLTSRPDREAANRLHERLGFEKRETLVFRFHINSPPEGRAPYSPPKCPKQIRLPCLTDREMHSTYMPSDAAELFSDLDVPWMVAGGCAIDFFLGE